MSSKYDFETALEPLPLALTHTKVLIRHITNSRQKNLLGVAELQFFDEDGFIALKVRGIRISKKNFPSGDTVIDADFPAYQVGGRYYKSFLAERDGVDFFHHLKNLITEAYQDAEYQLWSENNIDDD